MEIFKSRRIQEAELTVLVGRVNEVIPRMNAAIDEMIAVMRATHDEVDLSLRAAGIRK